MSKFNARTAVASAISNALSSVASNGSLMLEVASTARKHFGDDVPKDDQNAIADTVAKSQGWSGAAMDSRKSEVRVILRACAKLPEYLAALKRKADAYTWHDAMKLARQINSGATVRDAVAYVTVPKAPGKQGNPKGRALSALLTLYKAVHGENRDVIRKAARMMKDAGIFKVSAQQAEKLGL